MSNKNAANGYAPLDGSARLPSANLPTVAEVTTHKNAANGYAGLSASSLVASANLGTGGDGSGTHALFDNGTFQTLTGGGTVIAVAVTSANGVSGTSDGNITIPHLTLALGAITPTSIVASGNISGANLSGTNTGDQTITLTGNVTGSGTGSFATTIANSAVTYAKIQNVAASSLIGNATGSPAAPTAIALDGGLSMGSATLFGYNSSGTLAGTSVTPDCTANKVFTETLTGNTTVTGFVGFNDGDSIVIRFRQAAAASYTVTWPGAILWSGGTIPTQTATFNKYDLYFLMKIGTVIHGRADQNY
jgi:hypothetical protein